MSPSWRPLLSGEAAARALAAAREVAEVTARGVTCYPADLPPGAGPSWENALSGGRAGQLLLHAYLALHEPGGSHAETALDLLDQATEAAATLRLSASFYLGFPGIAWTATHLAGRLFPAEEDDGQAEVEEILWRSLSSSSWRGPYDLFDGLVGLGVYALERLPRPGAARCVEAVVARLAGSAETHPEGAAWLTPAATLPPQFRSRYPAGAYVLGMAQGMAGVIAFLGAACQAGIATRQARPLLAATVSWLLARERPPGCSYRFPQFHFRDVEPHGNRLAWQVGDLGIAASLFIAARGAGEPAWEAAGRRIALAATARRPAADDRSDAGLSDGAAGIGHVFNRLHQASGETAFAESARFWLRRALDLREPGLGLAGFRMTYRGEQRDEPGFIAGATGIALALLAAASHVAPAWDRALLLSTADRPETHCD